MTNFSLHKVFESCWLAERVRVDMLPLPQTGGCGRRGRDKEPATRRLLPRRLWAHFGVAELAVGHALLPSELRSICCALLEALGEPS
jgi:hypothetical protein